MSADEIRDALAKMTPGDWREHYYRCDPANPAIKDECGNVFISVFGDRKSDDAAGIVTLRNKVPALLEELAAATARADAWEADAARYASNAEYWKARADKAEAALRAISSEADKDITLGTTSGATFWRAGLVFARDAARAALEANDAGR